MQDEKEEDGDSDLDQDAIDTYYAVRMGGAGGRGRGELGIFALTRKGLGKLRRPGF